MTRGGSGTVSTDTLRLVREVREKASRSPGSADLAALLTDVSRHCPDVSVEDVKLLSGVAIRQAGQVSYLLGKLAGLLGEEGELNGA